MSTDLVDVIAMSAAVVATGPIPGRVAAKATHVQPLFLRIKSYLSERPFRRFSERLFRFLVLKRFDSGIT